MARTMTKVALAIGIGLVAVAGVVGIVAYLLAPHIETSDPAEGEVDYRQAKSVYEFNVTDIDGNEVSMEKYRGHVLIIVNVACLCGNTNKSYTQLQALHEKYAESKGLRILGFPCNQFGNQEPWPEPEIKAFITKFNVQFDMFSKIKVNGDDAHPLWKYLKHKQGGTLGNFIKWNFTKFLVDKNGKPVERYSPTTEPFAIEKDLPKYW